MVGTEDDLRRLAGGRPRLLLVLLLLAGRTPESEQGLLIVFVSKGGIVTHPSLN